MVLRFMDRALERGKDWVMTAQMVDDLHYRFRDGHRSVPSEVWEISLATARKLAEWKIEKQAVEAALLTPLIEHKLAPIPSLTEEFGRTCVVLAQKSIKYRSLLGRPDKYKPQPSPAELSNQLRYLYRQAYLELPELNPLLLLLANHYAYFEYVINQQAAGAADTGHILRWVALQTNAIMIPVAERLGIWELRRHWLEQSIRILQPEAHEEFSRLLGLAESYTKEGMAGLLTRRRELENGGPLNEDVKRWFKESRLLFDKAEAFASLHGALNEVFRAKNILPRPKVRPIPLFPGITLRLAEAGKSREELLGRLSVRLFCHSIEDCYRVLGIIHSLGKPVAPRFSERFDDFIASPQLNGYRALHTAIIYVGYKDSGGSILIEFRILTPAIHRLNEYGVAAALHRYKSRYLHARAWWHDIRRLDNELKKLSSGDSDVTLKDLLKRNDLGSQSNPIYVFTPAGQIVLLDKKSRPLDYAYKIHTELGNHAGKIEVNNQTVMYDSDLRNGDLIQVYDNPHSPGPDLSWLGYVATSTAQSKIKRALIDRAGSIHSGRVQIEEFLIKIVLLYKTEKHFILPISTERFEAYLFKAARHYNLGSLEALYSKVLDGSRSAHKLVNFFISEVIGAALVSKGGEPSAYPYGRLLSCPICRPTPGESLVVSLPDAQKNNKAMVIHNQQCLVGRNKTVKPSLSNVPVEWAAEIDAQKNFVEFNVQAENRYQILGSTLNVIYGEDAVFLYKVNARAIADGQANISLILELKNSEQLVTIQKGIECIAGVRQVFCYPVSHLQRLAFVNRTVKPRSNPYTVSEVFDRWMFYNRERHIEEMKTWLASPPPTRWMILHGQKRVGKTSLVNYLTHEVLANKSSVIPVLVDLQSLSRFGAQNIAHCLVDSVYTALNLPLPKQEFPEEPISWLDHALKAAVEHLRDSRLLIIIDEFNILLEAEQDGELEKQVFANLRYVMTQRRDLNWLLIVQDTHFRDPQTWGTAGPLFQQAEPLQVPYLDYEWSKRLIIDPAQRSGFDYESAPDDAGEDIPSKIYNMTAGNPYLIQVLCEKLIQRVMRQQRTTVTHDDLSICADLVISEGSRYFDHFIRNVRDDPFRSLILKTVAVRAKPNQAVAYADLAAELVANKIFSEDVLMKVVRRLERLGILEVNRKGKSIDVSIPIDLFHQWVSLFFASSFGEDGAVS